MAMANRPVPNFELIKLHYSSVHKSSLDLSVQAQDLDLSIQEQDFNLSIRMHDNDWLTWPSSNFLRPVKLVVV